jgi:hypothetical protein
MNRSPAARRSFRTGTISKSAAEKEGAAAADALELWWWWCEEPPRSPFRDEVERFDLLFDGAII